MTDERLTFSEAYINWLFDRLQESRGLLQRVTYHVDLSMNSDIQDDIKAFQEKMEYPRHDRK